MMRKEKERKKATSRRDKPKQEEVDNDDDGYGDGDKEAIDDKDLDIVARMDDILKTYERTRRQWFWHNSSESTKNLANFNMKGMPPFAASLFWSFTQCASCLPPPHNRGATTCSVHLLPQDVHWADEEP